MSNYKKDIIKDIVCPKCNYKSAFLGWQLEKDSNDVYFFIQCENRNCYYLEASSNGKDIKNILNGKETVEKVNVDFKGQPGILIELK